MKHTYVCICMLCVIYVGVYINETYIHVSVCLWCVYRFVSCGWDKTFRLWDLERGEPLVSIHLESQHTRELIIT